jgi:putative glutamine amidotransferase
MKVLRIGLTLRGARAEGYDEVRDALAREWSRYFQEVLIEAVPYPILNAGSVTVTWVENLALDGLILTGGGDPGDDPLRDETEAALLTWAGARAIPVLGICRGFQVMQRGLGGTLDVLADHVGCRHPVNVGEMPREVNSYHAMGIRRLASGFTALAVANDGTIEAAIDEQHRWLGLMWHPEREPDPNPNDSAWIRAHFGIFRE